MLEAEVAKGFPSPPSRAAVDAALVALNDEDYIMYSPFGLAIYMI